mmetsp:Transcript_4927/g.6868  ORF Transcript_4927/g.6868 Transcript_4927/m.6868 type:complete len:166 (-) Transcript_4927:100-597(-)
MTTNRFHGTTMFVNMTGKAMLWSGQVGSSCTLAKRWTQSGDRLRARLGPVGISLLAPSVKTFDFSHCIATENQRRFLGKATSCLGLQSEDGSKLAVVGGHMYQISTDGSTIGLGMVGEDDPRESCCTFCTAKRGWHPYTSQSFSSHGEIVSMSDEIRELMFIAAW